MAALDLNKAPVVLFWEITKACALSCIHCRAKAQPKRHPNEITLSEANRLVDDIASFRPPPILVVSGGDPLMRPDLFDVLSYAVAKGLQVSLSPTATALVTPERLTRAKEIGVARLSFSLDGPSPEVHDAFRGFSGSFARTITSVSYANEVGLPFQINTTVTRRNADQLGEIAQLVQKLGAVLWDVFFLVPTGRGLQGDVISAEEHERVFNWLFDLSRQVPFRVKTTLGQHYRRVTLQRLAQEGRGGLGEQLGTNDGKGICFISHVGEVFPSGFLPVSGGNVRRESLVTIYQESPLFRDLRDPSKLKGKCGRCTYNSLCGGCRARAYAYTGDWLEAEPLCIHQPLQ